jgi:DNA-binding NarL/FixJ family response regulator
MSQIAPRAIILGKWLAPFLIEIGTGTMFQDADSKIRVMIVDNRALVREGLIMMIKSSPRFEVAAQTGNLQEALSLAEREQPDVILLDLNRGVTNGVHYLPELLKGAEKARVLVLVTEQDVELQREAMLRGAMGVVQKEKNSEILFKAIEKVHAGEVWYDRSKMGSMFAEILHNRNGHKADPETEKISSLSQRERDVVTLISQGMKNRAIGEKLFISETTVRHHLTAIFEKLGVSSRLELIIYALSRGLATLPEATKYQTSSNGVGAKAH